MTESDLEKRRKIISRLMSSHIYSGHPNILNSVCFPSVFLWQHTGSFINAAPFGTQWGYLCKERWLMKWADTWCEIFLCSRLESLFVWEKEHKDVLLWRHRKEPHIHSWAPCMALFCRSRNFSKCHRYDLFYFFLPLSACRQGIMIDGDSCPDILQRKW